MIVAQPGRPIGYPSMTATPRPVTRGVLTYGTGSYPGRSGLRPDLRPAYEVEVVMVAGRARYVVAVDINAAEHD